MIDQTSVFLKFVTSESNIHDIRNMNCERIELRLSIMSMKDTWDSQQY